MTSKEKGKIIIDNDAGGDDAIAIFLALLFEKYFDGPEIIGLTTANGNTDEDQVCINNQKILKLAKRQDIPIYRGAKKPLFTTTDPANWYGVDGLGDVDDKEIMKDLAPAHKQNAIDALIELSKIHEGKLTVITIGTLTNIALVLKTDPDFIKRLKHLYIGAGHIHDEFHSVAEFNARMDAEAYNIVAQHATPDKVTVYPFSTTKIFLDIDKHWRVNVLGAVDTEIVRAINKFERIALDKSETWASLDPSVIAVILNPDLVEEYKYSKSDIILSGEKRGITTHNLVDEKSQANVRVIYKVKHSEYKQFILDVFLAELKATK